MAEALVVIEDLKKSFQHMGRTLDVLRGIDLNIYAGEILCIVGPSGAGKSTLLHCMGTLDLPTSGRIKLAGDELTTLSGAKLAAIRNRTIGFVFQFHHLLPDLTVRENVLMPARIAGRLGRAEEERALELIGLVGMDHRLKHLPAELSGGERQRVALARALMNKPGILLCDEPSGNLDSGNSKHLHALLLDLNNRLNVAILVVTHDQNLAGLAKQVYVMEGGGLPPMPLLSRVKGVDADLHRHDGRGQPMGRR